MYVQVHDRVWNDAKFLAVCDMLDMPDYAVMGLLVRLWQHVLQQASSGEFAMLSARGFSRVLGVAPETAERIISALIDAGLIIGAEDSATLAIPNWTEVVGTEYARRQRDAERKRVMRNAERNAPRNAEVTRHNAQNAERQRRFRQRRKAESVTSADIPPQQASKQASKQASDANAQPTPKPPLEITGNDGHAVALAAYIAKLRGVDPMP